MGLFKRKGGDGTDDLVLPLPELDSEAPLAVDAGPPADAPMEEGPADLSAFEEPVDVPAQEPVVQEMPAEPAGEDGDSDLMQLFTSARYGNPQAEALLRRTEDIPVAQLLADLRDVRAQLGRR